MRGNMDIHGGGRTLFNRTSTSWPESAPTTENDGDTLVLPTKFGGGVVASYTLVVVDLSGPAGATVTLDAYLRFPEARYLTKWQLIKRSTVSDDYSQGNTYMIIPTLGANRVAVIVQSAAGSPTAVNLHGRAINDDQAVLLLDLLDDGGGGGVGDRRFQQLLVPTGNPAVFNSPAKFKHGGYDTEVVKYNGQVLLEGSGNDYVASESGGVGTGYDTITLAFTPRSGSNWLIDFVPDV